MELAPATWQMAEAVGSDAEKRAAPRYTLLIRAAKIVCEHGQFVLVIRDVSETGFSVRLFHKLPAIDQFELHMPTGATYEIKPVWNRDNEAGFTFASPVDVQTLINEAGAFPKRGLRLDLVFPVLVSTLTQRCDARVENLSQQGALLETGGLFAIDQTIRIQAADVALQLKEIRAKVRWRKGTRYGVVFEDTFTLNDFACLAARLQHPALLPG